MIYPVENDASWQNALHQEYYEHSSLKAKGIIQTSKEEQVKDMLKRNGKPTNFITVAN